MWHSCWHRHKRKMRMHLSPKVQRWRQWDREADQSGEKTPSSAIHLAVLMQCILMGFLQVALCSTPHFPNGSASSLQQSRAVLILETSRSRSPSLAKLPGGRGRHNIRLTARWSPGRKKKEHLYNPRGYVLGAGCNCFPHFLRFVKLIHYQRRAVMPRAWQWACFLWAFWHFLPCNSKQKSY